MHHFSHIFGADVVGEDGAAVSVRNALPVPLLASSSPADPSDTGAKAALGPFATALRGFLGPTAF